MVVQHEGLDVGAHQGLHLLGLLRPGWLGQANQHIQCPLHQNAGVLVGMGNDGS